MSRKVPRELEQAVYTRDGYRCVYCQRGGPTFEDWVNLIPDHFIPESAGGATTLGNLVTACHTCNAMKTDRAYTTVEEARVDLLRWWEQMRRDWEDNFNPNRPQRAA